MQNDQQPNISIEDQDFDRKKKPIKKNEISNFISKTFKILEDKDNFDTICWTDNGNSFVIKNKQHFQSVILPKYFKHSKFSSFVRQLNMYDFHKLRKEKEIQIFRHKYFKMNKKELLKKIKRKCLEENVEHGAGEKGDEEGGEGNGGGNGVVRKSSEDGSIELQGHMEVLAKENHDLWREIEGYQLEVKQFEELKSLRREKLGKIINAVLFGGMESEEGEREEEEEGMALSVLTDHFKSNMEPSHGFGEYKVMMRKITNTIMGMFTGKGAQ